MIPWAEVLRYKEQLNNRVRKMLFFIKQNIYPGLRKFYAKLKRKSPSFGNMILY